MRMSEIKKHVEDACEELGYKRNPNLIDIAINPRLKVAAGRAKWSRARRHRDRIELNPTALKEHTRQENIDTIRHEVAHLVTRSRDASQAFKGFCRQHGIPLHYEQKLSAAPYQIWCTKCGVHGRSYSRMGPRLKRIQREPNLFRCRGCDTTGTLEVRDTRDPAHIMEEAQMKGRAKGNTFLLTREEMFILEGQAFLCAQVGGKTVTFDRNVGEHGALVQQRFVRTKKPKKKGE